MTKDQEREAHTAALLTAKNLTPEEIATLQFELRVAMAQSNKIEVLYKKLADNYERLILLLSARDPAVIKHFLDGSRDRSVIQAAPDPFKKPDFLRRFFDWFEKKLS